MGFDEHFIQPVMACMTSSSVVVLIEGSPTEIIQPKRGISQGKEASQAINKNMNSRLKGKGKGRGKEFNKKLKKQ